MNWTRPETKEDMKTHIHTHTHIWTDTHTGGHKHTSYNKVTECYCRKCLYSVLGDILSTSQWLSCHSTLLQDIFHLSLIDVLNQNPTPPPFSQGVCFESRSSISRAQLYSNAIRQGNKGSIYHLYCIAPSINAILWLLKRPIWNNQMVLLCFYLWRNIIQAYVIVMKSCPANWAKRACIYIISHWQLHFVTDGRWFFESSLTLWN